MRILVSILLCSLLPLSLTAQNRPAANAEYGPAQVLNALRQLREQRGPNPPRLAACLRNSSDSRWSDLQAHFYCWLKADQRACFTGAVDGELKEFQNLKGDYDKAYVHCQEAKGRAYGINFDRPLARLNPEQGEVFKNLLYRRPMFAREEQRKILEAFYAGPIPERKAFPAAVASAPAPAPAPSPPVAAATAAAPTPPPVMPVAMNAAATMANPDVGEEDEIPAKTEGYPRACQVKSQHARTRQKPDSNSPVVAILDPTPIKVTGPAQSSVGGDTLQWYPVEFHYRGKLVGAYLAVSLVDCPK